VSAPRAHRRTAVRALFEASGLKVSRVIQVQFADVELARDLPRGKHRELNSGRWRGSTRWRRLNSLRSRPRARREAWARCAQMPQPAASRAARIAPRDPRDRAPIVSATQSLPVGIATANEPWVNHRGPVNRGQVNRGRLRRASVRGPATYWQSRVWPVMPLLSGPSRNR
jgi:hypothetical protein